MTADLRGYAHQLADLGYAVVPTATDGTKRPGITTWKHHQTAAPTHDQIDTYFTDGRTDGIGLITGTISDRLEMLEVEGRAADHALIAPAWTWLAGSGYPMSDVDQEIADRAAETLADEPADAEAS